MSRDDERHPGDPCTPIENIRTVLEDETRIERLRDAAWRSWAAAMAAIREREAREIARRGTAMAAAYVARRAARGNR